MVSCIAVHPTQQGTYAVGSYARSSMFDSFARNDLHVYINMLCNDWTRCRFCVVTMFLCYIFSCVHLYMFCILLLTATLAVCVWTILYTIVCLKITYVAIPFITDIMDPYMHIRCNRNWEI